MRFGDRYHLSRDRSTVYAKDREPIVVGLPIIPGGDPDLDARSRLSRLSGSTKQVAADIRPSGPGYLRWEDIADPQLSLQQNLNAAGATAPSNQMVKLTLPAGDFTFSDFLTNSYGLQLPPNLSIYGSGSGVGGTVFRMLPGTSTKASVVPAQGTGKTNPLHLMCVRAAGSQPPLAGLEYKNFAVLGTEQGHLYNGFRTSNVSSAVLENLYLEGIPGNSAAPPGETFGINLYLGSGITLRGVEVDGRRTRQGGIDSIASSPIGMNSHPGVRIYDSYFHHCQYGMPTFWQSSDGYTENLRSEYNKTGINHERNTNIRHVRPRIVISGRPHHISFMNDQADGTLTVIAPSWVPGTGNPTKFVIFAGPRGSGVTDLQTAAGITVNDANGNSILTQVLIAQ